MRIFLAPILLLTFLFPSLAYGVTLKDLVYRDGRYYLKFSEVPFSGKLSVLQEGLVEGAFKDGKRHGPWIIYHRKRLTEPNPFGIKREFELQITRKGTYEKGKQVGLWVDYHFNGNLKSKGTFKEGKEHGPWIEWWSNGNLKSKGTFKDGNLEGPWVFYKDNGAKIFLTERFRNWVHYGSGTYKNGKKISD